MMRFVQRLRRAAPTVAIVGMTLVAMMALGMLPVVSLSLQATRTSLPCSSLPGRPETFGGRWHLAEGQLHGPYRTVPPTSGPHSPRVIVTGVYREPITEELQVHFLEHGHILVQYAADVSSSSVHILEEIARRHLADVAVAPYPRLSHGIALTAWQRLQKMDNADPSAIELFIDNVAGRYEHGWVNGATDCLSA